ncbi:heat shock factor binding protein 1-domain-containing protein [Calycina marina]|uniref:Heat shock factor binding protein 1-domain-containing protein n=1 Tax=Calycina marina TaxID=1763456 RepID=A0A9P7Z6Y7_9HELO|nr:heat shock factor binding protein 1-domain-containing protein [Calycina marina]
MSSSSPTTNQLSANSVRPKTPRALRIPSNRSGRQITTDASAQAELSVVVDELLYTLSNKFAGISSEIFAKMDEMSRRLDNLEATIQSGDGKPSATKPSPTKKS